MTAMAVEARELGKTYRRRRPGHGLGGRLKAYFSPAVDEFPAVRNLDFDIRPGEGVGLIGENGAGKSTIVKMLTGVMLPTHGTARTLGLDPWKQRRRMAMNIGVVFGQRSQLLWDLPAADSFRLLKEMYRIPDSVYAYTYARAVERLELGPLLTTPVRFLSLGQRMRCDLAASLLHAPALAFLDEPTIGLDVLAKIQAREFLRDLRAKFQMTLVLITHDLKDITLTCERVLVLDKGSLLFDGGIDGFRRRFSDARSIVVDVHAKPNPDVGAALERQLVALGASVSWVAETRLRVSGVLAADVPRVTLELLTRLDVQDLTLQGDEIETMVARLFSAGKAGGNSDGN